MLYLYVSKQSSGNELMGELASRIQEGAMAFLRREYSVLAVFVLVVAVLLFLAIGSEPIRKQPSSFSASVESIGNMISRDARD
jgi:Na+/H+-translocating membrane pyrophosphatase